MPRTTHTDINDRVSSYDRLAWSASDLEAMLANGERRLELVAYFGRSEYDALARLAQQSVLQRERAIRSSGSDTRARVWILPGIMGSHLGRRRGSGDPADIIWLDPVDIAIGRLYQLRRAPDLAPLVPLGVLMFSYLKLKLLLDAAGFDARFFDYDWRDDIETLGQRFAAAVRADGRPASIVAHSLGGLVARAALHLSDAPLDVSRVVLLGTPNGGSFAAVQAIRGSYSVVRHIAMLDLLHGAEQLARDVFATFVSLYQMMPRHWPAASNNLFDLTTWPASGPRPRGELLEQASVVDSKLAPADARFVVIAGDGLDTVVGLQCSHNDFEYQIAATGDGTVPLFAALLQGAATYLGKVGHSDLPRNDLIGAAVIDILRSGATTRLPRVETQSAALQSRAQAPQIKRSLSDATMRGWPAPKVDWEKLSFEQRREYLERLNEPWDTPQ